MNEETHRIESTLTNRTWNQHGINNKIDTNQYKSMKHSNSSATVCLKYLLLFPLIRRQRRFRSSTHGGFPKYNPRQEEIQQRSTKPWHWTMKYMKSWLVHHRYPGYHGFLKYSPPKKYLGCVILYIQHLLQGFFSSLLNSSLVVTPHFLGDHQ